jgi:hypothetical protein
VIEEVIAQHPPVGGGGGSRRLRTPRIPIHLYMTTSIVGKLQHLGVQWQQVSHTPSQLLQSMAVYTYVPLLAWHNVHACLLPQDSHALTWEAANRQ